LQSMDPVALIDRAHLARQTFGDTELAHELLGLFAEQCRSLLPGIVDTARPITERADLAHTLKGSALGIGAGRVAHLSGAIEDRLRAGEAAGPTDALSDAVAETLAVLAPAT
jgi:HPt (histidine-containing phosphotransfer) domain-containing protein